MAKYVRAFSFVLSLIMTANSAYAKNENSAESLAQSQVYFIVKTFNNASQSIETWERFFALLENGADGPDKAFLGNMRAMMKKAGSLPKMVASESSIRFTGFTDQINIVDLTQGTIRFNGKLVKLNYGANLVQNLRLFYEAGVLGETKEQAHFWNLFIEAAQAGDKGMLDKLISGSGLFGSVSGELYKWAIIAVVAVVVVAGVVLLLPEVAAAALGTAVWKFAAYALGAAAAFLALGGAAKKAGAAGLSPSEIKVQCKPRISVQEINPTGRTLNLNVRYGKLVSIAALGSDGKESEERTFVSHGAKGELKVTGLLAAETESVKGLDALARACLQEPDKVEGMVIKLRPVDSKNLPIIDPKGAQTELR